jgi:CRISPR/Cas system-associated exonuclease Cas4 (RecB family)
MTKTLLQQIMVKKDEKLDTMHQSDLIKKIQSGYVAERGPKHTQKKTFAPSTIVYGHGECPRYWYLAFEGNTFDDTADAYAVANMTAGSQGHERIQKAMKDSGILIDAEFKITAQDPPIFGFGDVLLNWEGEELLGEIKTMMNEAFEYRKNAGKPKVGHVVQLLIYMKILKKAKGVLIYENKNNHELLIFEIHVNDGYIQWVDYLFNWMREVRKSWENKELPTKNYRSNAKVCKTCPVRAACADAGVGSVKIASLEELSETM